jgi:heptosyltransferase I
MMSALGDAVHVLPVVNALRRHDPAVHVTWVLQPGPASLMRGHPAVDEVVVFDRSAGWRGFARVRRALAGARFDLLLDLQVYFKASVVTALIPAEVKLGFDRARARDWNWLVTNRRIPPHAPQHVQEQYLEFLRYLGVEPEPLEWNLGPWPHERARQAELWSSLPRPAALLVIGSSHPEKEWLPERWAELADALHTRFGLAPVLAGGRSPRELASEREILRRATVPVHSTLGAPLRDLVALIDGSALVVSLDTGPMHMAVAQGTPTIALMGLNNPRRVGPFRRFADLLVDAYGDPGEDYPPSLEKRRGRMGRITVGDVLARVRHWDEEYRR